MSDGRTTVQRVPAETSLRTVAAVPALRLCLDVHSEIADGRETSLLAERRGLVQYDGTYVVRNEKTHKTFA
jgi:hypothetical protein